MTTRLSPPPRNLFVAFEGGDGSGKTTLRKLLYGALQQRGREVLSLIPTSWLIPECTEIITNAKYHGIPYPGAEITRAYVLDKEELCRRLVTPHLPWRHVIVDRYLVSDIVYHQVLYGTDCGATHAAYVASRILWPDLIVYVDTPPEVAAERMEARHPAHRNVWETLDKQRRVYDGFQEVLFGGRFTIPSEVLRVENTGPLEPASRTVLDALLPRMCT